MRSTIDLQAAENGHVDMTATDTETVLMAELSLSHAVPVGTEASQFPERLF